VAKPSYFTVKLGDVVSFDDAQIAVQVIGEPQPRIVLRGGAFARYVPTGHLVYARKGSLLAVPFDLTRLQVTGPPVAVLEDLSTLSHDNGAAHFALSETGILVYGAGGEFNRGLFPAFVDRRGTVRPLPVDAGSFFEPTMKYTCNQFKAAEESEGFPVTAAFGPYGRPMAASCSFSMTTK